MQKPNIVFIMADDMGYGDVTCFNPDSKIPTPHMDRLAAEGMRFTDAHSPSAVCTRSRYGVFSIRQGPWKCIFDTQGSGGWPPPRDASEPVAGSPGQLYNLDEDPAEQVNIWDRLPEKVAELKTLLDRYREEDRSVPRR